MKTESTPQEQLAGSSLHPEPNSIQTPNSKPKIVVIMGATGSGKSKLAIDLASHFPVEIINADSMQVPFSIVLKKPKRGKRLNKEHIMWF